MIRTATCVGSDAVRRFCGHGKRVHVSDQVTEVWHTHRQTAPDAVESFGVLIGTTSVDRRVIWIEQVTTPMPRDRRTRFSFALHDPGHQRVVCGMFARSGGRSIYLGTWHTHPVPVPAPSRIDRRDWVACQRANPGRPLVFALVGTDRTRVFVRKTWRFRPLSEDCGALAKVDPRESIGSSDARTADDGGASPIDNTLVRQAVSE